MWSWLLGQSIKVYNWAWLGCIGLVLDEFDVPQKSENKFSVKVYSRDFFALVFEATQTRSSKTLTSKENLNSNKKRNILFFVLQP